MKTEKPHRFVKLLVGGAILIWIYSFNASAQVECIFKRNTGSHFPSEILPNPEQNRIHLYAKIPNEIKTGITDRIAWRFAASSAYDVNDYLVRGSIYHDWPDLEEYVNAVFKKILPEECRRDTLLRVYIAKEGRFNAQAFSTGQIIINIGVFDDIADEASLAAILAHEFAHYWLNHGLLFFTAYETGKFDRGFSIGEKVTNNYSAIQELQADSLAIRLIFQSDYNIKGLISVFEIMSRYDRNLLAQSKNEWVIQESAHPPTGLRYRQLLDNYNIYKEESGSFFLISEARFNQYKKDARVEILNALLENHDYFYCTEKAFKFHLFDPANTTFTWYILEAVRRNCMVYKDLWVKPFITNNYYDTIHTSNIRVKRPMTADFLSAFNPDILPMSSNEYDQIKNSFYWDGEIRFKTYEEAFNYFFKFNMRFQNPEAFLTNAISYIDDSASRNLLLGKYLQCPAIANRDYAEALLNDALFDSLPNKRLVILNKFEFVGVLGQERVSLLVPEKDISMVLAEIIDSLSSVFINDTFLYLPSLMNNQMEDFLALLNIQYFSWSSTLFSIWNASKKMNPGVLNPQYWMFFKQAGINEILFINCCFYSERKSDKTLEPYEQVIKMKPYDLLSESQNSKYFDVLISSVRIKKTGAPTTTYYDGNSILNFKDSGTSSVIKDLKNQIAKYFDAAHKYDLLYEEKSSRK